VFFVPFVVNKAGYYALAIQKTLVYTLKKYYNKTMTKTANPKLLEILVCPLTKVPLRYDAAAQELISDQAGLAYPIRDGIPIMLVDEARKL